jgi:hypothetical protein
VASDPNENNFVDFIRLIRKYRPDYIISMTSGVFCFLIERNQLHHFIILKEFIFTSW